jgi:hypothetical protein
VWNVTCRLRASTDSAGVQPAELLLLLASVPVLLARTLVRGRSVRLDRPGEGQTARCRPAADSRHTPRLRLLSATCSSVSTTQTDPSCLRGWSRMLGAERTAASAPGLLWKHRSQSTTLKSRLSKTRTIGTPSRAVRSIGSCSFGLPRGAVEALPPPCGEKVGVPAGDAEDTADRPRTTIGGWMKACDCCDLVRVALFRSQDEGGTPSKTCNNQTANAR